MLNGQGPFKTLEEELFNNRYNRISYRKNEVEAWLLRAAREEQGEKGEDHCKTQES